MTLDLDPYAGQIGKQIESFDVITPSPMQRMSAWLDRDDPEPRQGDVLPAGWHSLYFLSLTPTSDLGPEGGTPHGHVVPHLPLTREMWIGSRLSIAAPMRVGDTVRRLVGLKSLTQKAGRSGNLVFVTVRDEFHTARGLAVAEELDIIFREDAKGPQGLPPAQPRPHLPQWSKSVAVDPPFLFRYSALTYNSHRLHYDQDYTTKREGYPGLLVTGPLQSVLMLDLVRRNDTRAVREYSCRASRPIFEGAALAVEGRATDGGADMWTLDRDGALGMSATVTFE